MRPAAMRSPAGLLALVVLLLLSCAGPANQGLPATPGAYDIQTRSVSFDGQQYRFYWRAADGTLHQARARDLKLVQDERSYLEIGGDGPVLHLAPDEPITVQHRSGGSAVWLPFVVPIPVGGPVASGPPPTTPSYRYPPTDRFGQGDTLYGSAATTHPAPPDYSKVRPAPGAVSGQNAGTGDGTAATNRTGTGAVSGQAGGTGSGNAITDKARAGSGAISGQAGGTGSGSAVTDKARAGTGTGAVTERQPSGGSSVAPYTSRDAPSAGRSSSSGARAGASGGARGRR
jgi:hypothetical protein